MYVEELPAGPELDALIAEKVMGFDVRDRCGLHNDCMKQLGRKAAYQPKTQRSGHVAEYSTDIGAAWNVLTHIFGKKCEGDGFKVSWRGAYSTPVMAAGWEAGMFQDDYEGEDWMIRGSGDTAPLAICRAALAVVEFRAMRPRPNASLP